MTDPTTKTELLARMRESYTAFEALLASLNTAQFTTPSADTGWSIKDVLVHLATWQTRAALTLQAAHRNEEPRLTPPIHNDAEMNKFNDEIFATHQSQPLETVWSDFRNSFQSLYAATEALSDDELFNAQRFAWREGQPLWNTVEGNTFGHYPEHELLVKAIAGQATNETTDRSDM